MGGGRPDAAKPDSTRGPVGHDEVGQARQAGNFGWPHFVGDNRAYQKFDFAAAKSLKAWEANAPTNTSPNNTGLKVLPPAQNAFVWYPYGLSNEFPLVGAGGRNAMAGSVFYQDEFKKAPRAFPKYYDGKLLIYDWMRGWIMAVSMDKDGNYVSMDPFMPSSKFNNPMDMEFAADGDLYMLEYGTGWFSANDDARMIRIEYNGGNRKPQIQIVANKMGGSAQLDLTLSAKGTADADGDALSYSWKIATKDGFNKEVNTLDADLTLSEIGVYQVTLTVDDGKGGVSTQAMDVTVGNEPPVLSLEMPRSNKSFYSPNQPFNYDIRVKDQEDGSLGKGIEPEQVAVNIDYLPEGYDKVAIAQGHRSADAGALFTTGKKLIEGSDCRACHSADKKSIGPTYQEVSTKYKGDISDLDRLTKKVISGGGGIWGETAMAAHPQLSAADASEMVKYILNITSEGLNGKALPVKGSYNAKLPADDKGKGVFILRAAYEDRGANGLPSLKAEQTYVLRNAKVDVHSFDVYEDVRKVSNGGMNLAIPAKSGTYMALKQIDLNGVAELQFLAIAPKPQLNSAGGKIEVRLDNPNGKLLGESTFLEPNEKMEFKPSLLRVPVTLPANWDNQLHDVYVVFVNPKAGESSLMVVMGAEV